MSCAAKLFNCLRLTRLQPLLDPYLRYEQNRCPKPAQDVLLLSLHGPYRRRRAATVRNPG